MDLCKNIIVDIRTMNPPPENLQQAYNERRRHVIDEYMSKPPQQKYYGVRDYKYFREKAHETGPNSHKQFRMCEIEEDFDERQPDTTEPEDEDEEEQVRAGQVKKDYRCG